MLHTYTHTYIHHSFIHTFTHTHTHTHRPAKLEVLKRELEHMQASFTKLRLSKTLYVDGLNPMCRGLLLLHGRVRREHAQARMYVHICICIYIYVYIHICIRIHTCRRSTYIYYIIYIYVCMYTLSHTLTHTGRASIRGLHELARKSGAFLQQIGCSSPCASGESQKSAT